MAKGVAKSFLKEMVGDRKETDERGTVEGQQTDKRRTINPPPETSVPPGRRGLGPVKEAFRDKGDLRECRSEDDYQGLPETGGSLKCGRCREARF